jgi:hypothetical protein
MPKTKATAARDAKDMPQFFFERTFMVPPACWQKSLPIEQLDREHVIRNIKSQRALM